MVDRRDRGRDGGTAGEDTLPGTVVDEAERLTRLARDAADGAEAEAYRRERAELLAEHGYEARIREEETGEVLVLYPAGWLEDGVVRTDWIEDLDRGVERRLDGPGDPEEWTAIDEHNRELAAAVADEHGPDHGANARAFAEFMSNHYARRVESASREEIEEFLTEYYPRNVWPSETQRAVVEESVELLLAAGRDGATGPRR